MAGKQTATPPVTPDGKQASVAAIEAAAAAKPAGIDWAQLGAPVAMPNRIGPGTIKVNVLESVPDPIRQRAEESLAVNTLAVAKAAASNAKRPRVNYEWAVQPLADNAMGEAFDKALTKYAKYRPAEGTIPHMDEKSPMGQVTVRTGVICHYKLDSDGVPETCAEDAEGAFLGIRYSVRPLEQRGDANRLPGTA